ncbi:MAG: LPXTG cell wall anchor domain-containing protein, partial [Solobacterium sp.]|nr:LPXTG cell wall anchor domain-containing protein [Solobacterium sp.]
GKEYAFSLSGGDSISFRDLAEALHILENNDNMDEFLADIEAVTFSDPDLVWAGKTGRQITAGEIVEENNLTVEYSDELSEEEITAFNAKKYEADEWVLVSLQPFLSEEELTVTMKDGQVFTIKVTDAQISKDILTASGETYRITVIYDDDAEIPEDAQMEVEEVLPDTVAYAKYLSDAAAEMGIEQDKVSFARFFDISIYKDNEKIEPKAPVEVRISYADPMEIPDAQSLSIIHFGEERTDIITDVRLSTDNKKVIYKQDAFSVTGTIVGEPPQGQKNKYMLLVKYPANSDDYYIINNDGSLTKVNYNASNGTVDIENPMMWTIDGTNPNRHIYFETEATGFNYQDTAADYFRRYLDPNSATGITEENAQNITLGRRWGDNVKTGYVVTNRDNILSQTAVNNYNDNGVEKIYHGAYNDNLSLGIELNDEGIPVHVTGRNNWNNAVNVIFAEPRSVPGVGTSHHTVDHIDISISGTSEVDVPLAYGTYYYQDSLGNWQEYKVTTNTTLHLEKDNIRITPEDMKKAEIKAFDINGIELNNAFVIDSYSSNQANGYSTVQVRIGGRFKVADTYDGGGNDPQTKQRRLENKITYSVSAVKELTFDMADEEHGQLYERQADGTYKPMSVTIDVNMGANFSYWDEANECPGIKNEIIGGSHDAWVNGGIPDHGLSGMDFVLGGDAEDANNKIVALEITKMIVDESGHLISLKKQLVNHFDVYRNGTADRNDIVKDSNVEGYTKPYPYQGYSWLHSKDVIVGTDGIGIAYDYAVDDGMYYITEKYANDDVPDQITDANNKTWNYKNTYIQTEYVRRGYRDYDNKTLYPNPMHYSKVYTKDNPYSGSTADASQAYASDPEVLGTFTAVDGSVRKSGFLEFFVYNVYTRGEKLDVRKVWDPSNDIPQGAEITVELLYRTRKIISETEFGEWSEYARVSDSDMFDEKPNTTLTLTASSIADQSWKGTYTNLPKTLKDTAGNVYEVEYSAEETSVKIPGPGKTVVDQDAVDVTDQYTVTVEKTAPSPSEADSSDGTVTITNHQKGSLLITKNVTYNGGDVPEDKMSLVNKTFTFTITKDGTEIAESPVTITVENGEPKKQLIDGLAAGDYVITESDSGGLKLTSFTGGSSQNPTNKSVTVTVTAGKTAEAELYETAKAEFNNNYADTTITLQKVDQADLRKTDANLLDGAKFRIEKYLSLNPRSIDTAWCNAHPEENAGNEGVFEFTELPEGYYRIVETKYPDGYASQSPDPYFLVREKAGTHTLEVILVDASGTPVTGNATDMIYVIPGSNTVRYGNTPGRELPETGGRGSVLNYIGGTLLSAAAGYLLYRRMRR